MNDEILRRIVDLCGGKDNNPGIGWPQQGNVILQLGPDNDEWGFRSGKNWVPFYESDIYAIDHFIRWLERKLFDIAGTTITQNSGKEGEGWHAVIFNPTMDNPERDEVINGGDYLDILLRAANTAVKYKWL